MNNSFFSVIITTYNRAALLNRALSSLIAQTEEDWEAFVIDDGSTDNTSMQIQYYLKNYPQIHYIKQSNQGAASAKNRGIAAAKGRFITFLDSDDEYMLNHLGARKLILVENPDVEFLYGGVKVIGNQYVPDRHNHGNRIHLSDCVIGGTFFIKREIAQALGGFKHFPVGMDADVFERINRLGVSSMKIHLPTYIYRREKEDSITHQCSKQAKRS